MEYCNFSYNEAWTLPIEYRKWFIRRKQKELEQRREAEQKARGKVTSTPGQAPPKKR